MQLPTTWSDTHASTSSHLCHTKEHGIAALPCRARDVGMARLWHGMVWHACMRGWEWMVWSSTSRLIMLFDFTDGIISSWMVGYIFQEYSILILYNSMWEKKCWTMLFRTEVGHACQTVSYLSSYKPNIVWYHPEPSDTTKQRKFVPYCVTNQTSTPSVPK